MKILLDTNAFLWQIGDKQSSRLGSVAKETMLDAEVVYVSAITIIEMRIKTMLGKLNAPPDIIGVITAAGNLPLEFSVEAADNLRGLDRLATHDPFDRMLVSQAQIGKLQLLTADQALLSLNLPFIIDARR